MTRGSSHQQQRVREQVKPKKHHPPSIKSNQPRCAPSSLAFSERKTSPPLPSLFHLSLAPVTNQKNSATIAWREEYKPDEITFDDIKDLNTGRLELSKDRDVDGRPLVFFRLR